MEINKENVDMFLEKAREFFDNVLEGIRRFINRLKKATMDFLIQKYWDRKELRILVYTKQKVKTKRLKKKYDDKIKRFIFRQMELKA